MADRAFEIASSPLFEVERRALADPACAAELGRRYAEDQVRGRGDRWKKRVREQWLRGFTGEPDPYRYGKGGNWARPLVRIWYDGHAKRHELEDLRRRYPEDFLEPAHA